ncbi:hypothetical protein MPL3356_60282 [Mesorhizobium plurifarium]|uniref:Uncharacterized protein n=1 Tax=Mesorhizobium plurifarium TaxID=69974 RepID=A0A090EGK7_MESPL|nr:hypothetical protein MPL3356_60282 [Mesorhizobium plurifarium]CDX29644.1 hypothetical protein MPLDJ20_120588 [Mesorhizobium plurifarium]
MDWSVNEDGGAGNRRASGCLPGLHSHFMAEWKPECPKVSGLLHLTKKAILAAKCRKWLFDRFTSKPCRTIVQCSTILPVSRQNSS